MRMELAIAKRIEDVRGKKRRQLHEFKSYIY